METNEEADDMGAFDEARHLIGRHGRRAQQLVVDEIVAAVRRGDDQEAVARGTILRAIDQIQAPLSPH